MSVPTPDALKARAERSAVVIVTDHDLATGTVKYDLLVSLIALGWACGFGDGFSEAMAEASALASRSLMHSVKA